NPDGVEQLLVDGFVRSIAQDRFAYLASFLHDFYNLDLTLGNQVSDEVVRANFTIATGASAIGTAACPPTWLTDFRNDVPKIDVPVLIIQGDADRILPFPATGKRLAELVKGSRLVIIKDGPHGIPWTHGKQIAQELLAFLKQPEAVGSR